MTAHKEEVEFIQQYFFDELDGTIDSCAREAASCGVPVRKELIVSVRRDMSEEIKKIRLERAQQKSIRPHPTLTLVKMPDLNIPVPPEEANNKSSASIELRRQHYDDLVLADSAITIAKAMKAVKVKFGTSVDVRYALASLKLARELHKQAASSEETVNPKEPLNPIKGVEKLSLKPVEPRPVEPKPQQPLRKPDEQVDEFVIIYDLKGKGTFHELVSKSQLNQKILNLLSAGVEQTTIKVFKQVKMKLQVSINFE